MTTEARSDLGSRLGRPAQLQARRSNRFCRRSRWAIIAPLSPTPHTRAATSPAILAPRRRPPTRCFVTLPAAATIRSRASAAATAPTDRSTTSCRSDSKTACRCSASRWSTIRPASPSRARAPRSSPGCDNRCAPLASRRWSTRRCRSTRFFSPAAGPTCGRRSASATGSVCRKFRCLPGLAPTACLA